MITHRPRTSRLGLALWLLMLLGPAPRSTQAASGSPVPPVAGEIFAGQPQTDALLALEERGLEIIFSSELVRPDMRVESDPGPGRLLDVLAALLAPHGLTYDVTSGGTVVIVAATPPKPAAAATAGLRGVVLDRRTGTPLPGAIVSTAKGRSATTDDRGRFLLTALAAGSTRLRIEAPGYDPDERSTRLAPGTTEDLIVELERRDVALEEIVVTPSRIDIASEEPATTFGLDRHEVESLPTVSGDAFRAAATLPGMASNELSARLNIRGGRADEVLVLLDGVELYEPYHLQDLDGALSIVAPQTIDSLELSSGGFNATYGDRMSGLMDIRTRQPRRRLSGHLGLSLLDLQASAGGRTAAGRASWLVAGRQGLLDRALEVAESEERPEFWDAFAKAVLQISPSHEGRIEWVEAKDDFTLDDPPENDASAYRSTYLWAGHQALVSQRVLVESIAYLGHLDRDRNGHRDSANVYYDVGDRRFVDVLGVRQDWGMQATVRQSLKWGFEHREIDSRYDYRSELERRDPLSTIRTRPARGTTVFDDALSGHQSAAFSSYRARPFPSLTLELGLRFDENDLAEDHHLSPRLNLVCSPAGRDALRFSWGTFYQSQRPNELQVADGEKSLFPDERTELVVAGYERALGKGTTLRAEVYRRVIDEPRQRWENLFEQISIFPELEADRVLLTPEETRAHGLEIFLRHDAGSRLRWRLAYSLAEIEDSIAGVSTPRSIDQTHALQASIDAVFRRRWHLDLTWSAHTGWPTTALTFVRSSADGETRAVPVLGPVNQERLSPYHRLDARLSREFATGRGTLTLFLDLLNVYDRSNVRGFELAAEAPEDEVDTDPLRELYWVGRLPSFGLRWEF